VREEGDAWKTNAIVSSLAFPIWAYAMGAVALIDFRDGNFASILLATFTVCSGLVIPPAGRPAKPVESQKDKTAPKPHFEERKTQTETGEPPGTKKEPAAVPSGAADAATSKKN
jgi:hypothetical protein